VIGCRALTQEKSMLTKINLRWFVTAIVCLRVTAVYADARTPAQLMRSAKSAPIIDASLAKSAGNREATQLACGSYTPCVVYRGCLECCGPKVSQILMVKDPCDCCCNPCAAEIPVCLPACCKNPCVSCKCGLFGRGIVTYSYDCGVCVTVVFRNCGDVVVVYRG